MRAKFLILFASFLLMGAKSGVPRTPKAAACPKYFATLQAEISDFWSRNKPVQIEVRGEKIGPLTFSFDSEVTDANVIRLIYEDPSARKELQAHVPEELKQIPLESLLKTLKISKKQLQHFGLRRGVDKEQAAYSLLDLSPANYEFLLMQIPIYKAYPYRRHTNEVLAKLLRKRGYPIQVHSDADHGEITHETSEQLPSKFRELTVNRLHREIRDPQTHLHIGIPAIILDTKTRAIARAVETRIILELAEDWRPGESVLAFTDGTSLASDFLAAEERGVIRLGLREFQTPITAHNLEIRQWSSIEGGMENLGLAAKLAQKHDRLITLPDFDPMVVIDPLSGNLYGALKYAGLLLKKSSDQSKKAAGAELLRFSKKVEAADIDDSVRKALSKYLHDAKVLEMLDEATFLLP